MQAVCISTCCQPPSRLERHGDANKVCVCAWRVPWRRLVMLVFIGVCVFVGLELWLWEAWSCPECQNVHGCSEVVYKFDTPPWWQSIYNDPSLMSRCGVYSQDTAWRTVYEEFSQGLSSPDIHTKCGTVKPIPLNPWHADHRAVPPQIHNASVPNIVHFISFGSREFTFLNFLSFLSVHKFVRPRFIYVHGDDVPYGYWWNRTLKEVPRIYFVARARTLRVQGYKLPWIEHSSDLLRLQTIYDNGGIYLDTDILVLKPFTPLLREETVLGRETSYGLGSGIILARPRAPFVCMWRQGFRTYMPWPWNWAKYAVWTPNKLQKVIPGHIHIEEDTFHRPNFEETDLLFRGHYDWSRNYAMHIWKRHGYVPRAPNETDLLDSTLGEIMRYIYYGDSVLRT